VTALLDRQDHAIQTESAQALKKIVLPAHGQDAIIFYFPHIMNQQNQAVLIQEIMTVTA